MAKASGRVEALLREMTLEEKAAQMVQIPYAMVGRERAYAWARRGAGSFLHVLGDEARALQREAQKSRLGIPALLGIDAVRGHALCDRATVFPEQLGCACAWNPELMEEMGRATAREVSADGLNWTFSPLLCLSRDLRWGRVGETFGEDPYLTGELAAALIRGYQGDGLADGVSVAACAKHFAAYGEAVGARDACDSEITFRKLREVFLPPFQKAVDAGCQTFMTAYGSLDGTPVTADPRVLRGVLRGEMGFDGFVVTDWRNVSSLVDQQFVAEDARQAALLAALAGNDMMMSSPEFYEEAIALVREGRLDEAVLDEAVRHILTVKERLGLLDSPERRAPREAIGCEAHQQAALALARRGVTLLRNDGALPFGPGVRRIAVVGKNADDVRAQYADWTYFSHPLPDPAHTPVRPYTTLREGIERLAAARGIETVYARGCGPLPNPADDLDAAVEAAQGADAIVLAVGDEISQLGEAKDRADLSLSGAQDALFRRLRALGKPLVTVLIASKPLAAAEAAERSDAFLAAFGLGAHGGQALAEALFGEIEPSGRLPVSFPRHSGQTPVYYNALPGWHKQGDAAKYCDLPATPLFSFGEGLAYTKFAYRDAAFDPETLIAEVTVKNAGDRPGLETVQVYFRDEVASVLTPVKQLIAFRQAQLEPGEEKRVAFQLKRDDFSLVDRDGKRRVEPGSFTLMLGHSAKDGDLLKLRFSLS